MSPTGVLTGPYQPLKTEKHSFVCSLCENSGHWEAKIFTPTPPMLRSSTTEHIPLPLPSPCNLDQCKLDHSINNGDPDAESLGQLIGFSDIARRGMLQALLNLLSLCFRPSGPSNNGEFESFGVGREGKDGGLFWYRDIGRYESGDFLVAVVQASQVLEDQSQIECGLFGTFVRVYDGHNGLEVSRYVCAHFESGI